MPEARDRLLRQEDVFATYSSRRRIPSSGYRTIGGGNPIIFNLDDEVNEVQTPFRWRGTPMAATPGTMAAASRRDRIGTPRTGRAANFRRSPAGGSDRSGGGARRRGSSILPSWYPRRPLQDITFITREIQRRRVLRGESEGRETESPMLQDRTIRIFTDSSSDAQLEHDISTITPHPNIRTRRSPPPSIAKVKTILLNIANQNNDGEDSSSITPQKKLLNNIDKVEKVVMEELRKLERTPSARKAEREKRVRALMSMR